MVGLAACNPGPKATGGGSDDLGFTDGGVSVTDDTVTLNLTSFTIPAGGESFKCQTFANPFGGDAEISAFESHMTPGSHHMLLLFEPNAVDGELADCSGFTFGAMPYAAQKPDNMVTYPDGMAAVIKADQGFKLNLHYLNTSTSELTANVKIILHRAKPGTVTTHAGVFFLNNITGVNVAPGETKVITASYKTTIPMNVLYATAHMHSRSQKMEATTGGAMFYTTEPYKWDTAPFQAYAPAQAIPAGSTITWSCTVVNDTGGTLTFGESANTNEMCIFNGQYYPVPDGANPMISVMR